jgi:hypothetical protein
MAQEPECGITTREVHNLDVADRQWPICRREDCTLALGDIAVNYAVGGSRVSIAPGAPRQGRKAGNGCARTSFLEYRQ